MATITATRKSVIAALKDSEDTRTILTAAGMDANEGMDVLARMLKSIERPTAKVESAASRRNAKAVADFAEKVGEGVIFDGHDIANAFPTLISAPARTAVLNKGVAMGRFCAHRLTHKVGTRGKGSVVYQLSGDLAPWGDED